MSKHDETHYVHNYVHSEINGDDKHCAEQIKMMHLKINEQLI